MIKAAIFDLDGVIVDTARYHYLAWKRLAKELGVDLTPEQNESLKGLSRRESLEEILKLGSIKMTEGDKVKHETRKNEWFVEYIHAMKPEEIYAGVKPMLQELQKQGYKLALASSSKNAHTVINLLGIENEFDEIVDGGMVTQAKPNPEIFLLAAKLLQVSPAHCVVFEDAAAGVEAAVAAGMKCVGIGSPTRLGKANSVVKETRDFNINDLKSW